MNLQVIVVDDGPAKVTHLGVVKILEEGVGVEVDGEIVVVLHGVVPLSVVVVSQSCRTSPSNLSMAAHVVKPSDVHGSNQSVFFIQFREEVPKVIPAVPKDWKGATRLDSLFGFP